MYRNLDAPIPLFLRIEVQLNVGRLTDSANLKIRWAYQAMRMLSAVSWYVCNQVHRAFEAGRAACDVDAGELRHHFLKGGGGFEDLGRQMQQTPNGVQIGGAVTVRQKAIMADSDKA